MTRLATRTRLRYAWLLLALLCAASVVHAQPIDDPAFSEPPPPPKPPARPSPVAPTAAPATSRFVAEPAPAAPEVQETTDVKESFIPATETVPGAPDLYERVAAPTMAGSVGLLRTHTGDSGGAGRFRVGLHLGGFQQDNFLIAGVGTTKGDTNGRFTGDLTIGYTPIKYLEVYLGLYNQSNHNSRVDPGRTDPEVILSLGDFALGLKGRYPATRFLDVALHTSVRFLNSVSGISFDGNSTNWAIDAIASLDVRHIPGAAHVPLRFHLNIGYLLDNSVKLLPPGQCAMSTSNDSCIRSRVVETFAYGIGSSRIRTSIALDAPLTVRSVGIEPFLEYHADASVGDGDQTLVKALKGSVPGDRLSGTAQQWLTFGLRVRPVAGLILDGAVDVGVQSPGFQYGPPLPQWNLIFGAAYAYDPTSAGPKTKVVTKTITREISRGMAVGKLRAVVRDAKTKRPISGASVHYLNRRESPQQTDTDGTFVSYGFSSGPVALEVSRDDYHTARVDTQVAAGRETPVEVLLTAKPPQAGQLRIHVADETGAPVSANVRLSGPAGAVDADSEGSGNYSAKVPGGEYTLDVVAPQYLAKQKTATVQAGQIQSIEVVVHKKPAMPHVAITKDEIKLRGTVHFGTNNAEIKPDGEQLLDEVVDLLVKHPELRKLRVEGHTDNRGAADVNLQLSKARAAAVVQYLVKQGIDSGRLESEGYGATQPLVPNLTPANRAKNRRVMLRILEQGAAP